jgi:hypothetical protein
VSNTIHSQNGQFKIGPALRLERLDHGMTRGGLQSALYQGEWDAPPRFSALKPDRTGRTGRDFDLSKLPSDATFASILESFLRIDAPGPLHL